MRVVGEREAQADLADLLDGLCRDRQAVALVRDGAPVAALVPIDAVHTSLSAPAAMAIDLGGGNTVPGEAILRAALELGRVGAWIWDNDKCELVYCSDELARLVGLTPQDYLATRGRPEGLREEVHPDDRDRYITAVRAAMAAGECYSIEYRKRAADGRYLDVREAGQPLPGMTGARQFTMGIVQDITQVKDAERALRVTDRELRRAQRQAQVGSWRWNLADGSLISCSEEYARIHGVRMDEVKSLLDADGLRFVHPHDLARVEAAIAQFAATPQPFQLEYRIVRPDGEVRHVLKVSDPVPDEHGIAVERTGIVRDITERVRMQSELVASHQDLERRVRERTEQLAQSEGRYRAIFEGTSLGIGRARFGDGKVILSNRKLAGMFGYASVEEFVSEFAFSGHYVDPQDHFRLAAGYTSNPEQPFECEFTRKDGSIVVLQVHALAHFDASHVDFICIDITDRTQAERALLEGEEHLHSLLDNSPNLICLKDPDGRFLFLNKQYKELFDLTTEDAAGKTAHDLFPEPVAEQAIAHDRAVIESRTAIIREETGMPSKEDVFRDYICCKFPLFGRDDRITAIATIRTDITERRAAQRKLEQAEKLQAMGQLTGGLAHDFNNLLAVVRVNAELLEQRYGNSDKSIAAVLHATSCASDLIGRLLSFAREQPLDLQKIDVAEVVQEVSRLVERNVGPLVEIAIDIEPHVWPALADPVALETALLNLVFNARDAMPEGGRLTIECRNETIEADPLAPAAQAEAGDYVAIAVLDTGTGMDAESQARACEPFYTTKDMSRGTGLGLSVVYGFVQQMGGHLHIESSEGAGTTVRLCLPRAASAARPRRSFATGAIATSGGQERILVVEDDPDLRAAVGRMLRSLGYDTVEASDARTAAEMFMSEPAIDLVLTDIVLPKGKSGPEFIADLRRSQPDLKAVFMSGCSDPCDALVEGPGNDAVVLKKPFHGDQLADALRKMLDSHCTAGVDSTAF